MKNLTRGRHTVYLGFYNLMAGLYEPIVTETLDLMARDFIHFISKVDFYQYKDMHSYHNLSIFVNLFFTVIFSRTSHMKLQKKKKKFEDN